MRPIHLLALTSCAALSACIFGGHDRDSDAPRSSLVGRWQIVAITRGGQDINLDQLEGAVRELRESTYSIHHADGQAITGRYVINDAVEPKTIDEFVDNGRFASQTLKGIYRIHDQKLTISFAGPGQARPTSFTSEAGTSYTVAIHERVR